MIRLRGAACFLPGDAAGRLAFGPADLDIPTDRVVAVLDGSGEARTTLLRLLAGRVRPDAGTVFRPAHPSPVINDEKLLHPALTGLANLRFLARAYGVDHDAFVRAIDAFCGLGALLPERVRNLDGGARRTLEASAAILLPFDVALIDDAQQLPARVLADCRAAARARGTGLIFATSGPRAQQGADAALILNGASLTLEMDPPATSRAARQHA